MRKGGEVIGRKKRELHLLEIRKKEKKRTEQDGREKRRGGTIGGEEGRAKGMGRERAKGGGGAHLPEIPRASLVFGVRTDLKEPVCVCVICMSCLCIHE